MNTVFCACCGCEIDYIAALFHKNLNCYLCNYCEDKIISENKIILQDALETIALHTAALTGLRAGYEEN
jgi:hypothetical protein